MEKKNLVCCAFLCSLFLNAIHGMSSLSSPFSLVIVRVGWLNTIVWCYGCLAAKKCEENCVVKHCQQILQQGKCDDDKMCFAACKKQFNTTEMAFCLLPDKQACNCYYTCWVLLLQTSPSNYLFCLKNMTVMTGDEGPISDCTEKIKLEGCNNAMCAGACMDKVKGAVSGTCLPGNHACDCFIPCWESPRFFLDFISGSLFCPVYK